MIQTIRTRQPSLPSPDAVGEMVSTVNATVRELPRIPHFFALTGDEPYPWQRRL